MKSRENIDNNVVGGVRFFDMADHQNRIAGRLDGRIEFQWDFYCDP